VIRHRQIQTQEPQNGTDQAFSLPESQPKHRPQRQGCSDRQRRVVRLTAACRARLGPPGGNGILGEPDRETAPLTQGGVVLRPIRDPVPLLRNPVRRAALALNGTGSIRREGVQASYVSWFRLPTHLFVQQGASYPLMPSTDGTRVSVRADTLRARYTHLAVAIVNNVYARDPTTSLGLSFQFAPTSAQVVSNALFGSCRDLPTFAGREGRPSNPLCTSAIHPSLAIPLNIGCDNCASHKSRSLSLACQMPGRGDNGTQEKHSCRVEPAAHAL
jgi:hypothetical protein